MSEYKFNRLHIHLTDAAGWRIEIKRYPRLNNFAAWRSGKLWKDWNANGNKYLEQGSEGAEGGYYLVAQRNEGVLESVVSDARLPLAILHTVGDDGIDGCRQRSYRLQAWRPHHRSPTVGLRQVQPLQARTV